MTVRRALIGVVTVCVVLLGGCAPVAIGTTVDSTVPVTLRETDVSGPWAYITDGALDLAVSGSSSCPSVPVAIDVTDPAEAVVTFDRGPAILCTADSRVVVYRLEVDVIPDRIVVVSGQSRRTVEVSQP